MADLVVRNLNPALVRSLKKRAASNGRSAEAEHRAILESTLAPTKRQTFAQALASMPNVGHDDDFRRIEDTSGQSVSD
jgi:plasmid stability protein